MLIKAKLKIIYHGKLFNGVGRKFRKITKNLGLHLRFKTTDLQDIIYTTLGDEFRRKIINSCLFVPTFIPSVETQAMFIEPIKNIYTISFDSKYTDRKLVIDGLEFQADIGST